MDLRTFNLSFIANFKWKLFHLNDNCNLCHSVNRFKQHRILVLHIGKLTERLNSVVKVSGTGGSG